MTPRDRQTVTVHGTCVAIGGIGVLLRGAAGDGKSDLALRLVSAGAMLVADDQVRLRRHGRTVMARAPTRLAGLMEVRGIGLVRLAHAPEAALGLIADLAPGAPRERLPEVAWSEYLGTRIRRISVAPFEASAPDKLRIAAYAAAGETDPVTGATIGSQDEE